MGAAADVLKAAQMPPLLRLFFALATIAALGLACLILIRPPARPAGVWVSFDNAGTRPLTLSVEADQAREVTAPGRLPPGRTVAWQLCDIAVEDQGQVALRLSQPGQPAEVVTIRWHRQGERDFGNSESEPLVLRCLPGRPTRVLHAPPTLHAAVSQAAR